MKPISKIIMIILLSFNNPVNAVIITYTGYVPEVGITYGVPSPNNPEALIGQTFTEVWTFDYQQMEADPMTEMLNANVYSGYATTTLTITFSGGSTYTETSPEQQYNLESGVNYNYEQDRFYGNVITFALNDVIQTYPTLNPRQFVQDLNWNAATGTYTITPMESNNAIILIPQGTVYGVLTSQSINEPIIPLPEPSSIALLAAGFLGFGVSRKKATQA